MAAYLGRRLLQVVLILLGISVVTFALLYLLPADPAAQVAGRNASAETIVNVRHELGLDRPIYTQYFHYLDGLLHGDLGRSYLQRTAVTTLIVSRFPATLQLMLGGVVCELALGLTIGIVAALRRNSGIDQMLMLTMFITSPRPSSCSASPRFTCSRSGLAGSRSAAMAGCSIWCYRRSRSAFSEPGGMGG
jgi:peptide/nickel transport system permease protein